MISFSNITKNKQLPPLPPPKKKKKKECNNNHSRQLSIGRQIANFTVMIYFWWIIELLKAIGRRGYLSHNSNMNQWFETGRCKVEWIIFFFFWNGVWWRTNWWMVVRWSQGQQTLKSGAVIASVTLSGDLQCAVILFMFSFSVEEISPMYCNGQCN